MNSYRIALTAAALWAAFSLPALSQGLPSTIFNTTPPTLSDGQQAPLQADNKGNLKVTGGGATPVTVQQSPATGTGGTSAVTVGVASAQVSAAATRTARLAIKNESTTASIACNLGGTAALNTAGNFTIQPGLMLTLSDPTYVPGDAVNCIASAASTPATVWSK